jgi:H+/gluconate symporter-like permease
MYERMARAHVALMRERGQGTVEYVGLILLMGVLIAGVLAATGSLHGNGIANTIADKLKTTIDGVGAGSKD